MIACTRCTKSTAANQAALSLINETDVAKMMRQVVARDAPVLSGGERQNDVERRVFA